MLVPARRHDPEWMDHPDNPRTEVEGALRDIRTVNRLLGGERALLRALRPFLKAQEPGVPLRILDVGTGGGDLPEAMVIQARQLGRRVRVVALERDPSAARVAARTTTALEEVQVIRADALSLPFRAGTFDVVTASMFLHHFDHQESVHLMVSFRCLARKAVLINDLRRHLLPWAFIRLAAGLTRRHPMFVHDAPLSVLRGFTPTELLAIADDSGGFGARLDRRWPFRLVLTLPGAGASP